MKRPIAFGLVTVIVLIALIASLTIQAAPIDLARLLAPPPAATIKCETEQIKVKNILTLSVTRQNCRVYLTNIIESPDRYSELLMLLDGAKPQDQITFYLRGIGGRADSATLIMRAIRDSKAHVTGIVDGDVSSAHAMIMLAVPDLKIEDYVVIMMHIPTYNRSVESICKQYEGHLDRGQSSEVKCINSLKLSLNLHIEKTEQVAKRLLTSTEIKAMLEGHDINISGKEAKQRLGLKS